MIAFSKFMKLFSMAGGVRSNVDPVTGEISFSALGSTVGSHLALRRGSAFRAGKPIIRAPSSASGVLVSANVTISATTRRGRSCWEVTFPAETSVKSVYWPITSRTYTDKCHVTFEVEDAAEWNGGSWRLALFTDINLNVGMRYTQTVGASNGWSGMHCISPLATEWSAVGAGSFASTMTYAAFQGVRKSSPSGTTRIWIYEIAEADKQSLPSIIIGADDGAKNWYTDGLPLCEKYGWSSYLAFIADERGTATRMSSGEWSDAIARGHHAVVHGCKTGVASLRDYFSSYTGYATPYDAILADITYNRDVMVAEGLDPDGRGRKFYVLPQGYHQPSGGAGDNTILNAMSAAGMTTCRRATVENGLIVNGAWNGARLYLPIIGHSYAGGGEATNISNLVTALQNEINAGRSVVFMFHEVKASPSAAEHISPANLETLIAAASDLVASGAARRGKLTDLADELATYTTPIHIGT